MNGVFKTLEALRSPIYVGKEISFGSGFPKFHRAQPDGLPMIRMDPNRKVLYLGRK